jgi:hypothetical protein
MIWSGTSRTNYISDTSIIVDLASTFNDTSIIFDLASTYKFGKRERHASPSPNKQIPNFLTFEKELFVYFKIKTKI